MRGEQQRRCARTGDGVGCGSSSSTRTVAALKARASRRQSRRGRCSGVGKVGTRRWAARRGADGNARSRRGVGVSRVRERERARVRTAGRGPGCCVGAGEAVRAAEKSRPALCVATLIYGEGGRRCHDCLGIMAWYGDSRGFYGDEMIFVVGESMRMLVTGGNEGTNARQEYKIVCLVIM